MISSVFAQYSKEQLTPVTLNGAEHPVSERLI